MKKMKIIILTVTWVCSIVCTAVVVSVVKDNSHKPEASVSVNDEETEKTEYSASISQTNYENWGFENVEEWGGTLLTIYPDENGKFVFSDNKGKYVIAAISEFCYIQFYPDREEIAISEVSVNHTMVSPYVNRYKTFDNNTVIRMDLAGTSQQSISISGRKNESGVPVFQFTFDGENQSDAIPYKYIDTTKTIEFYETKVDSQYANTPDGIYLDGEYLEYYKEYVDYYKVYLK